MSTPSTSETSAAEILLVEANHGDVRLIRELFAEANIANDIHVVYDDAEAVDFIHRRGDYRDAPVPDVVLLDLKLPGRKSEQVLTTLEDEPRLADTPVIGMTGCATEAAIAQSFGIDPDAFVQKPPDPDAFVDIVREYDDFALSIVRTLQDGAA